MDSFIFDGLSPVRLHRPMRTGRPAPNAHHPQKPAPPPTITGTIETHQKLEVNFHPAEVDGLPSFDEAGADLCQPNGSLLLLFIAAINCFGAERYGAPTSE